MIKPTISIFGCFQNGKSTLINCLFNQGIAMVGGVGLSVTKCNTRYIYGKSEIIKYRTKSGKEKILSQNDLLDNSLVKPNEEIIRSIPIDILRDFDIVDTPGFNANEAESTTAQEMLDKTDFAILLLRNKGLSQPEKNIARQLSDRKIPFIVLINCYDEIYDNWKPDSNGNALIASAIMAQLRAIKAMPLMVNGQHALFTTNLMWYQLSTISQLYSKSLVKSMKMLKINWNDFFDGEYSDYKLRFSSNYLPIISLLENRNIVILTKLFFMQKRLLKQLSVSHQNFILQLDSTRKAFLHKQAIYVN